MSTTTKKRSKAQSHSKAPGEDHPVIDAATLQAQVDRAATPADSAAILKAVEAQRVLLLNVHSAVRCLKVSDEADGGELCGALELIEHELLRVLGALEGPSLEQAVAAEDEAP